MFLRAKRRLKDGKEHRYWSVVENCRSPDGRVVDVHVPTTERRHFVPPRISNCCSINSI